jgi:DNA-binding MarR family transcriptional regulator
LNLWRTYDCLKAIESDVFGQVELSAQQYNSLRLLRSVHPEPMQTLELGRRLISRGPDTTRMLDRLERRTLIERRRPQDNRRVVEVVITLAGLRLLDDMKSAVRQMHRRQLGHLTTDQQRQLLELLKLARQPHEDASCDWLDL